MKSPWAWFAERRQIQREMQEDAVSYYRLLADIQDLSVWCHDFPDLQAGTQWLTRNDALRRWQDGDPPVAPGRYWGPVETFHEQLVVRRNQQRRR